MLNELKTIEQFDKNGMFDLIYHLPDQCEEAVKIAKDSVKGLKFYNILNVVICGMGGSAIGGDLTKIMAQDSAGLPIFVSRDYNLPSFVDEKTLVIASSYSGNTEETLAAYDEAKRRKARIVAITTGGELKKRAMADEVPVITIPSGMPPRAAVGYSLFPLLVFLEEIGIIHNCTNQINGAIELMRNVREELVPKVPEEKNPAKVLARKIYGKLPVIYGSQGITDALAVRWKGQLNENGKYPAFFNVFPELNHNEIVGFEADLELLKMMEIIILRSPEENERIKKRIEITSDLIRDKVSGIHEIWPKGNTRLERIMYHLIFGDYVSAYVAILNKKDPTEIDFINILKERMKG
ncbi:MAG: bifunctional phosphoglucose/phosphomannose isomerase [Thermosediminibacteraceae bacterium]|nr:bifunctional phosphoglucose/phosphomannose isomerase [Thermosediminibacteraceae bacterium]